MKPSETHSVLIMDQSPVGQKFANELAAGWAPVEERMTRWRASNDAFFAFFLEQREGGRAGSMTAKDLDDDLLCDVLPILFRDQLMPPAMPGFGVTADDAHRIWTEIERLRAVASASSEQRP